MSTHPNPKPGVAAQKDDSQLRQKEMIATHYSRLARCGETGEKNAYTFVFPVSASTTS